MKGGDMSKGFCIIGRYVRNGEAPLDTRDWVEKAECLKVYFLEEKDNCKMII